MGLCKCPKRKVTQHFCFEHKVNVCEYCMLSHHPRCIVRPYLQWLEDSSYEPVCGFCQQNLSSQECVRLICYHIFHWNCLNHYATSLPGNTAPGGYTCPDCYKTIFPQSSDGNSPIAQQLKKLLSTVQWARAGLGLPLIDTGKSSSSPTSPLRPSSTQAVEKPSKTVQIVSASNNLSPQTTHVPVTVNHLANYVNCDDVNFVTNARKFHHVSSINPKNANTFLDIDEDKYRRKSPMEFISKWIRTYKMSKQGEGLSWKGWIVIGFLAIFTVFTLVHYFLKLGRETAAHDPLLDPRSNPHIRIASDID